MFLKLDVFAPLSLSVSLCLSYFVRGKVKNFIFYVLLDILVDLTPFHLNKNMENKERSFG